MTGEGKEAGATRDASAPQRRERILNGMLEAVGAEGYEAASVRAVLERTGLYRQAFYDNFSDKDACYREAFDAGVERVEGLMVIAAAEEESWQGQLRAGLEALLEFLESEPDIGRALIVEVHSAGPEVLAKRAEAMKRAEDFIDLARSESQMSEMPPPIASQGIVAGIHSVLHMRLSSRTESFRELLPEFMYLAMLSYFGAEAASAELQIAGA